MPMETASVRLPAPTFPRIDATWNLAVCSEMASRAAISLFASPLASICSTSLSRGVSDSVAKVRWDDWSDAFPAFITLVATPLTFSIATGLSLGLLSFTFIKIGTGRIREISPLIWVLSVLFLLRYAFLGTE